MVTKQERKHLLASSFHIFKFCGLFYALQYVIGYILYQPDHNFFQPPNLPFYNLGNYTLLLLLVYFISYFLIDYLLTKDKKKWFENIKIRLKASGKIPDSAE